MENFNMKLLCRDKRGLLSIWESLNNLLIYIAQVYTNWNFKHSEKLVFNKVSCQSKRYLDVYIHFVLYDKKKKSLCQLCTFFLHFYINSLAVGIYPALYVEIKWGHVYSAA